MALWVDDFPFPVWWDMLVSWRVSQVQHSEFYLESPKNTYLLFHPSSKVGYQPWRFTKQLCTESFWNRTKPGKAGRSKVESGSGRSFINKIQQVCHLASDLKIPWISYESHNFLFFFRFFLRAIAQLIWGFKKNVYINKHIYTHLYTYIY